MVTLNDALKNLSRKKAKEERKAKASFRRSRAVAWSYAERQTSLESLGFRSYQQYLGSDLWKGIRRNVLLADPWCRICDRHRAYQVHHQSYDPDTMAGKDLSRLISICRSCHKQVEYRKGGKKKRAFHEARRECDDLLRKAVKRRDRKQRKKARKEERRERFHQQVASLVKSLAARKKKG